MGRSRIHADRPLTAAERSQRHRAKLRALRDVVVADAVIERLKRDYGHASLDEKNAIRKGVTRLLTRWHKDAEAYERWGAKQFPKTRARRA